MKNIPLPVFIVAILFIVVGITGFIGHLGDFSKPDLNFYELIGAQILRLLAVVGGVFLSLAVVWARWLCIGWVVAHVVISVFNSVGETVAHLVFLVIVAIVLYLPVSTSFFRHKMKSNEYRA